MKHFTVLSLVAFWLSPSIPVAVPQTTPPQAAATSLSQQPKWTEADRKKLLAKAQRGDRGSQMWLGAAYEQGWFGKPNFHEALKWFRKAAAQGDPDAQPLWAKRVRMAKVFDRIVQTLPNGIEWRRNTSRTSAEPVREETI